MLSRKPSLDSNRQEHDGRAAAAGRKMRTASLAASAMCAFAANSLLCRMALARAEIDPASFTAVRTVSAAAALVAISLLIRRRVSKLVLDRQHVAALTAYLVFFAFAYASLSAATGALILFGAVQLSMLAWALRSGERLSPLGWLGLASGVGGLAYLVSPGLTAPHPLGAFCMTAAGIAWGAYSLLGRKAVDPLATTTANFVFAAPLVLLVVLAAIPAGLHISAWGVALAVLSGAAASGCGYVIWYMALPGLARGQAAAIQLSVPVIAALGSIVFLSEPATVRLGVASTVTLGGVAMALAGRGKAPSDSKENGAA
jgi:drug/metabolite transporter (DMT)-like permease